MKRKLYRTGTLAISVAALLTLLLLPASADDSGHADDATSRDQVSVVITPGDDSGFRAPTEHRSAVWEW
jgi:hypothetical protein